jgi:hypothetical protein
MAMTDAATLTLTSFIHGLRTWRRVGERERIRRDGRQTVLGVWRSTCVICDRPRGSDATCRQGSRAKQKVSRDDLLRPSHDAVRSREAPVRSAY